MSRLPDAQIEIEFELGCVLAQRLGDRNRDDRLVGRLRDAARTAQEVDEIVDQRRVA